MTFKPPGYVSIASTPDEARLDRICECPACTRDGQHEPMCSVHDCDWDEGAEQVCDCPKDGTAFGEDASSGEACHLCGRLMSEHAAPSARVYVCDSLTRPDWRSVNDRAGRFRYVVVPKELAQAARYIFLSPDEAAKSVSHVADPPPKETP